MAAAVAALTEPPPDPYGLVARAVRQVLERHVETLDWAAGRARELPLQCKRAVILMETALRHLMRVDRWNRLQAELHVAGALEVWQERSRHTWALDLRILADLSVLDGSLATDDRGQD